MATQTFPEDLEILRRTVTRHFPDLVDELEILLSGEGREDERCRKLLDEVSFDAPDMTERDVVIDGAYVNRMLADIAMNEDLSRYIL